MRRNGKVPWPVIVVVGIWAAMMLFVIGMVVAAYPQIPDHYTKTQTQTHVIMGNQYYYPVTPPQLQHNGWVDFEDEWGRHIHLIGEITIVVPKTTAAVQGSK